MILFPGIITTMFLDKVIEHKPWNNFRYSLFIVFYGVLSYALLQVFFIIYQCFRIGIDNFRINNIIALDIWDLNSQLQTIPYKEILYAGVVAFLIGVIISFIEYKEYFSRFLLKYYITEKYGDYGVYYQLFKNSKGHWLDIVIWNKNLLIRGKVISIHEANNLCELCIEQADIYRISDDNIALAYAVDYICIAEPYDNLIISTIQKTGENNE